MKVFIVEDDSAVADALAVFVGQLGHAVQQFTDAEGFFAGAVPGAEDCVLVDLCLPGIDGAQVIRWLNALAEPPRVIAITGQSQTMIREFLNDLPRTDLLRKPLSASELSIYL